MRHTMPLWQKLLPWAITAVCLTFLYTRIQGAAAAQGSSLVPYLAAVFARVNWVRWLSLMIPYCLFFFLLDTLILWRVINWFNAKIDYQDIIPVRASSYILSILNEQVSKGAIALYLHKRANVPAWEVGSSMLFIMFCEIYYLMIWATIGVLREWERLPEVFHVIPSIAVGAAVFFVGFFLYFRGRIAPRSTFREKPVFHAFRKAKLSDYALFFLMRSPMMLGAVFVYTLALRLFGIEAGFSRDPRLSAGHPVRCNDTGTDAVGGHSAVGGALPRKARRDHGLRFRAAQLLHPVQRGDRAGVPSAGDAGPVRSAAIDSRARWPIEMSVVAISAQQTSVTADRRSARPSRTRVSPQRGTKYRIPLYRPSLLPRSAL